jgi:hypothetical protein
VVSDQFVLARLKDVIFGDAALNYEEGKWVIENGNQLFQPEFSKIETTAGNISSFAENKEEPTYKYGTYVSGSAVRQDADAIFKELGSHVRIKLLKQIKFSC